MCPHKYLFKNLINNKNSFNPLWSNILTYIQTIPFDLGFQKISTYLLLPIYDYLSNIKKNYQLPRIKIPETGFRNEIFKFAHRSLINHF